MTTLCRPCLLRAQALARQSLQPQTAFKILSTTTRSAHGGLPSFRPSTSEQLDQTLSTLQEQYFVPAHLNRRQRKMMYGDKYKSELENNENYVSVGDQEFRLRYVNRRKDIAAREPLVKKALKIMQELNDFSQLPALLDGLTSLKAAPPLEVQEKLIRRTVQADQFGIFLSCLSHPEKYGLTLKDDSIVQWIVWGLHTTGQTREWSKRNVTKAIKFGDLFAQALEQKEHARAGDAHLLAQDDPRINPIVIGVFLELAAVNAYKHNSKADTDGSVKRYVERLTANFDGYQEPPQQAQIDKGFPTEFWQKFPVWHGLSLANKILGDSMPNSQLAKQKLNDYETRLKDIVTALQQQDSTSPETYVSQALNAWNLAVKA